MDFFSKERTKELQTQNEVLQYRVNALQEEVDLLRRRNNQFLLQWIEDNVYWIQDTHGQGTEFVVSYEKLIEYIKGESK